MFLDDINENIKILEGYKQAEFDDNIYIEFESILKNFHFSRTEDYKYRLRFIVDFKEFSERVNLILNKNLKVIFGIEDSLKATGVKEKLLFPIEFVIVIKDYYFIDVEAFKLEDLEGLIELNIKEEFELIYDENKKIISLKFKNREDFEKHIQMEVMDVIESFFLYDVTGNYNIFVKEYSDRFELNTEYHESSL
ncbi:MAG: hypothetical protein QXG00_08430 [Candidatus Woesearchaeota archaeon]